jgi:hypothetical protein
MPSLKRWSELSADEKDRLALKVEAMRIVHRAQDAADALLAGANDAAIALAGESRMLVRLAVRERNRISHWRGIPRGGVHHPKKA